MKRLVNYSEEKALDQLDAVGSEYGLRVHSKVRVADVLPIEGSGVDALMYRFALQAHFDFVIVDEEHNPIYAVEFDGPSHDDPPQAERDRKKNELCKRFGFPILRTNLNQVSRRYRDLTVLAWTVHVHQLQIGFDEAQARGDIPYDEPFDPFFLWDSRRPGKKFPYWLSLDARMGMRRLQEEGKLRDFSSSGWVGCSKEGTLHGIEYISTSAAEGLMVRGHMRAQDFPAPFSELLEELLAIFLYEKVGLYLRGEISPQPIGHIDAALRDYRDKYSMLGAHAVQMGSAFG